MCNIETPSRGGEQLAKVFRSKTFNLEYNEQQSESNPGETRVESDRKTGADDVPRWRPKRSRKRGEKKGKKRGDFVKS